MTNTALAKCSGAPSSPPIKVLVPYWPEEAGTIKQVASRYNKSDGTIRSWCQNYFLGRIIGPGRWGVSWVAVEMFMDGDKRALNAYLRGDRTSPNVVRYYERLGLEHLLTKGGA
jgi:hypothetical protein